MKILESQEYISSLRELVKDGREVQLPVAGNSMSPFLVDRRDVIWFEQPDSPVRRGDMVFYERPTGDFIMHRVHHVSEEGVYLVGDAQTVVEGPLDDGCIFARVTRVQRKGRMLSKKDFLWRFFAGPWLALRPARRLLLKVYTGSKRRFKGR